jgi:hypothetical protein
VEILVKLLGKGYGKTIAKSNYILTAMIDQFSTQFTSTQPNAITVHKLMRLLSVIGELIRSAPPPLFCMKRKFILSLLQIDREFLEASPIKKDILAVLAVLYEYISKHLKALDKLQLRREFKIALLSSYSLVDEQFTNRFFNQSLYNLAVQGELVTTAELTKYSVFPTLTRIIGEKYAIGAISKL